MSTLTPLPEFPWHWSRPGSADPVLLRIRCPLCKRAVFIYPGSEEPLWGFHWWTCTRAPASARIGTPLETPDVLTTL